MPSKKERKHPTTSTTTHKAATTTQKLYWGYDVPTLRLLIIAAVVTLALYVPSLLNGFVNWDDPQYVYNNPIIQNFNAKNLWSILSQSLVANYHPLTMLSLAFNYAFSSTATGFHVLNWLLHIINTVLVFVFTYRLSGNKPLLAFVCSLFFGIHPMHVESVAWVSGRKDVLFVLFYLAALLSYLNYRQRNSVGQYVGLVVFALLSLVSKPAAVTLPLALLLVDYWQNRPLSQPKVWVEKLPLFALSLLFGVLTIQAQTQSNAIAELVNYSLWQKMVFASYGFAYYIVKLFLPFGLAAFHSYPSITNNSLPTLYLLSPIVALGIAVLLFVSTQNRKVLAWGVLFYLLQIVLVLQFVTIGSAIVAERYTYLSYLGLFFIMGYFLQKIYDQHANKRPFVYTIIAAFALLCVVLSTKQISTWQSGETLWTQVIKQHPNNDLAYLNRGDYYKDNDQAYKAFTDITEAIRLKPNSQNAHKAYNYLGNYYFAANEIEKALDNYNKAIALNSTDKKELAMAYIGKASCKFAQNKIEEVGENCNKAIELDPTYADAYLNRGIYYAIKNQHDKAVSDYTQYLLSNKQNAQAFTWRGVSLNKLAKYNDALQDFNAAIALNPNSGECYYNRSLSYTGLGNATQAQTDVQKAIQLGYQIPK